MISALFLLEQGLGRSRSFSCHSDSGGPFVAALHVLDAVVNVCPHVQHGDHYVSHAQPNLKGALTHD